ncbi:MAG TPA: efflux RND transporter periplasmic adaptor subunit [Candidatus Acidoferrum sp.]|nr:efflux RND transporter periplasmic adaptor subunit [Candidatus Acidoferrum sp.]
MPQKSPIRRRFLWATFALVVIALLWLMVRPAPLPVEVSKAVRGPMQVTVDEDGETRAHDRFVVAAPIPGRMQRVALEEGDLLRENQVVALIEPLPLNQQQREEVLGRIAAAEAGKRQAGARVEHAREDFEQARREHHRAEQLSREKVISTQALEQARNAEVTSSDEFEAAKFSAVAAESEVKIARAGLLGMDQNGAGNRIISLRSPVSGRVLRVIEKSERVVSAGTPILIMGDPAKIEVVTDVLTTDAVNIHPGAAVFLEGWGGDHPLRARVRLVEPAGFTKISALGVEEKRVNVIADFVDSPSGMGDGYRVEVRIVTWESAEVLKLPSSAAFRDSGGWSTFVVEGGRARRRPIQIGHRNQAEVELLSGLTAGDVVILHPPNQLQDGIRVRTR